MDCPACKKPMAVLELENVEVDFCFACEGCWLDRGELGLILTGAPDVPEDLNLAGGKKSSRRCPRCNGRMRAGPAPGTDVEVDVCARHHGVWLDKGELQTIARERTGTQRANALADFVSNMFGGKKA
ncbi:MAG: hypothetical protein BWK77_02525 [Verrucomicrobia bacterium A1]|nr:MAG: hypothetical protein BWK77_02525 [Verrucomicrobia bacterium A1]